MEGKRARRNSHLTEKNGLITPKQQTIHNLISIMSLSIHCIVPKSITNTSNSLDFVTS